MEKYVEDARSRINDHGIKLNDANCYTKRLLHIKFRSITRYLVRFTQLVNVKNFDRSKTLSKNILQNLDGFSYMLYSLPLVAIFNLSYLKWVVIYVKDIIYAIYLVLRVKTNCNLLHGKLNKLKTVSYQLWHMCLKQLSSYSRDVWYEFVLEIIPSGNSVKVYEANVITEESREFWNKKFGEMKSKKDVLKNWKEEECNVCYTKNADLLNEDLNLWYFPDIAVLPDCVHFFCIPCLTMIFKYSEPG